ncbi:MAG TPA: hypothetical protein VN258_04045 [Mobilitalea sp.]|nr:hypothetical protein [Mobilitalea sp.]
MYHITLDITSKIIFIEFTGGMNVDEINAYINDLLEIIDKFSNKELSMLVLAQRMDVIPQNCLQNFMKTTEITLTRFKKVAAVHSRFVTQMQMKRLEAEVYNNINTETRILRFKSKKEALDYLLYDKIDNFVLY